MKNYVFTPDGFLSTGKVVVKKIDSFETQQDITELTLTLILDDNALSAYIEWLKREKCL